MPQIIYLRGLKMNYEQFYLQMKMLKNLKQGRKEIEKTIEELYDRAGVKGVRYDLETIASSNRDSKLIDLSDQLREPQYQLDYMNNAIKVIEPIVNANLKKLPDEIRDAVKLVIWEGKTYHEVGSLMGYSDHGMWSKIRREIDKI